MSPDEYRELRSLFLQVIALPYDARGPRIEEACAGRAGLRTELEALVGAHERDPPAADHGGVEDLLRSALGEADPAEPGAELPERIGRYRLLEELGRGGMSVVYLAEQESPRRRVALKVLHPWMTSRVQRERFEQEARLLGSLHHTGIAQVYEAGVAETPLGAQPFLALEWIEGPPLSELSRAPGLDARGRVALLVKVCRAVQHAHERGIIHRDLKPGNILVGPDGEPKVLDFGVARRTDEEPSRRMLTTAGEVLGTLPYMSPEQVRGAPEGVDVRTDVYALGAIGYELLTGALPVELEGLNLAQAAQAIGDVDPIPLGARDPELRGDLETILGKALAKDGEGRYASAGALADDLTRYLRGEPISARPPSALYHLRKLAGRHREIVLALVATLLTLVAGIAGTTWQALRATSRARSATLAQEVAQREAARSRASLQFVDGLFASLDPDRDGRNVTLLELVTRGEEELASCYAGQPDIEGRLRSTLGVAYLGLGLYEEGESQLRHALQLTTAGLGPNDPASAAVEVHLASALLAQNELDEAEDLLERAGRALAPDRGPEDPTTIEWFTARAQLLGRRGRQGQAADLLGGLLRGLRARPGIEDRRTLSVLSTLAHMRLQQSRLPEAEELLLEGYEVSRAALGEEDSQTMVFGHNLASLYDDLDLDDEALAVLERVRGAQLRRLGPDHKDTLATLNSIAGILDQRGERDRAAELYGEILAGLRRRLRPTDPEVIVANFNLGVLLQGQGRLAEAEAVHRALVAEIEAGGVPESPDTLMARYGLALLLEDLERFSEADELFTDVLERARRTLPNDHWFLARVCAHYGGFLFRYGCAQQALPWLREAHERFRAALGDEDPRTARCGEALARAAEALRRAGQGEALAE